jgi:nanoRNase/pAp phosphatase (c-di-AMP/oligoRNAs hydrolase)
MSIMRGSQGSCLLVRRHASGLSMAVSTPTGKGLVQNLMVALDGPGPLIIISHDNPDPDALASAATLKYMAREALGKDATIALGGIVGRAENRAMLTYLNISLVPMGDIDIGADARVALVDTQPGRSNNPLPESTLPAAVIDHHPAYSSYENVPFCDLREEYGATSTIFTEYLRESGVAIEAKIATALFYGIAAETQDLGREAGPPDIAASQFLYPYTNKRRLAKIENARVPREYFSVFRDAIEEAVIYGKIVISDLGEVRYPDMVAEVADFLLRLDAVEWAAAMASYGKFLHVSVRTTDRSTNAGELLRKVLGSRAAGGHDLIAGGRVRIDDGGIGREKAAVTVKDRLLKALSIDTGSSEHLVG